MVPTIRITTKEKYQKSSHSTTHQLTPPVTEVSHYDLPVSVIYRHRCSHRLHRHYIFLEPSTDAIVITFVWWRHLPLSVATSRHRVQVDH